MAEIGQRHNLPAFAENFLARGIAITAPPEMDPAPPRDAAYRTRRNWVQRQLRNSASELESGRDEAADFAQMYRMFDHGFRLKV